MRTLVNPDVLLKEGEELPNRRAKVDRDSIGADAGVSNVFDGDNRRHRKDSALGGQLSRTVNDSEAGLIETGDGQEDEVRNRRPEEADGVGDRRRTVNLLGVGAEFFHRLFAPQPITLDDQRPFHDEPFTQR